MSNLELLTSQTNIFGGMQKPFDKASYVVFGVPFDATSSCRTGARFMPAAVRQASLNVETYSFRSGKDLAEVAVRDAGDIDVSLDANKTVEMCRLVTSDIVAADKVSVAIGGNIQSLWASSKVTVKKQEKPP